MTSATTKVKHPARFSPENVSDFMVKDDIEPVVEPWKAYIPADPFTRFDQHAFDRNIGRIIPMRGHHIPGTWVPTLDSTQDLINARIVDAEVDDDGGGVTITYEAIPKGTPA